MTEDKPTSVLPSDYPELVESLKKRIQSSQVKASLAVNKELVLLYYDIGSDILTRQKEQGWGMSRAMINDYSREPVPENKGVSGWKIGLIYIGVGLALPAFLMGKL